MNSRRLLTLCLCVLIFTGLAVAIDQVYLSNKVGQIVNPGQLHTARSAWEIANTSASDGNEPNDLAVDERTYLTVLAAAEGGDSKISVVLLHTADRQNWNAVKFRCIGITDNGTVTYQVYAGTLGQAPISGVTDCELAKVGQLAFTIGTQVSATATYEMADAVAITEGYSSVRSWLSASPGNDGVAEGELDVTGADVIVIVPTVVSANSKLLITGY